MKTPLSFLLLILSITLNAQKPRPQYKLQNPDTVKQELRALFQELSIKHPGFYRYNEQEQFDSYIDSVINSIEQPLDELEILRKTKPIIAKIGCLHTGIQLSKESEQALNSRANCLPLSLTKIDNKVYIWKAFGPENPVKIGEQIISINGRSIDEIYSKLLSAIPMDGVNQSGKDKLLQYNFPQWYRNMIEVRDQFEIETADGTKHYLQAIKEKELPSYQEIMNKGITFEIRDQLAILRIPSFADSYLEAHQQSFKQEIRKYMEIIEEQKLEKLLLDLRGNTGGTDSHAAYLSSFFFNQSYRYWKYIEVTEAIAKDLKGGKRLFYGKPTFQEGKWLWTDKGLYGKEFSFTKPQKGSKNPFNGSLYILTDGLCMSSCADFSSIMQFNKKALIIGEETGGGYMGNTSGLIPSQELENGLVIDIPLLKYYNFVDPDLPIGRGCIPDVELLPVFKEIKDPEAYLVRVLTYINQME